MPSPKTLAADLLRQVRLDQPLVHRETSGWRFSLSRSTCRTPEKTHHLSAEPHDHVHFSAVLVPPGRSSKEDDWFFLGQVLMAIGCPDPDGSCLTPVATTPADQVHHWHWTLSTSVIGG